MRRENNIVKFSIKHTAIYRNKITRKALHRLVGKELGNLRYLVARLSRKERAEFVLITNLLKYKFTKEGLQKD